MKAAYIERVGPPESIRYRDLPVPALGQGDVLVKVSAVSVNPVDTYIRSGQFPMDLPFPFVVGRDMAGVVQAVGSAVTCFQPGARVWCNNQGYHGRQGTFAEFVAVDEGLLYPLPVGVGEKEAVAFVHSGLTACLGLRRADLRSGESLFVQRGFPARSRTALPWRNWLTREHAPESVEIGGTCSSDRSLVSLYCGSFLFPRSEQNRMKERACDVTNNRQ